MMFFDFFLRLLNPTPRILRRRIRIMEAYARRCKRKGREQKAKDVQEWADDLKGELKRMEATGD
jgi:hypothetical protein